MHCTATKNWYHRIEIGSSVNGLLDTVLHLVLAPPFQHRFLDKPDQPNVSFRLIKPQNVGLFVGCQKDELI